MYYTHHTSINKISTVMLYDKSESKQHKFLIYKDFGIYFIVLGHASSADNNDRKFETNKEKT